MKTILTICPSKKQYRYRHLKYFDYYHKTNHHPTCYLVSKCRATKLRSDEDEGYWLKNQFKYLKPILIEATVSNFWISLNISWFNGHKYSEWLKPEEEKHENDVKLQHDKKVEDIKKSMSLEKDEEDMKVEDVMKDEDNSFKSVDDIVDLAKD
ncbi:hypothetical protein QL285_017106 [Trifolium repens]|nr:hypothetical protein QL285_017106 [Trifolium repens]